MNLLEIQNVKVEFPVSGGLWGRKIGSIKALQGVSLTLEKGKTLGIVGESGCGKSTLGRAILQLIKVDEGKVIFQGQEIGPNTRAEELAFRRKVQVVFQDPFASLNPRMTVRELLLEPLEVHDLAHGNLAENRAVEALDRVGIPAESLDKYPHEFSGGQRQRIVIARALSLKPELLICDEPVSALDVSVQSQILNLLRNLQTELNLSLILISHDLKVVEYLSDEIAVMYLGKIVEQGPSKNITEKGLHPYTRALLSAAPTISTIRRPERILLHGDVPSSMSPPSGCNFHPRCPWAEKKCSEQVPTLTSFGDQEYSHGNSSTRHSVACIRAGDLAAIWHNTKVP